MNSFIGTQKLTNRNRYQEFNQDEYKCNYCNIILRNSYEFTEHAKQHENTNQSKLSSRIENKKDLEESKEEKKFQKTTRPGGAVP